MLTRLLIALHRAPGFVGQMIRWQTRSPWSHASVMLRNGSIIEAREFIGVRQLPYLHPREGEEIHLFAVYVTPDQASAIEDFLHRQLGARYDYPSVLRFISRRRASPRSRNTWFCSELVFAAFASAGVRLLRATEPWEVSPGLLARSPFLHPFRVAA